MTEDDDLGSWADILAERSLEGRAVVEELRAAEAAVLSIQARMTAHANDDISIERVFNDLSQAMEEVERLRTKVYRLARQ